MASRTGWAPLVLLRPDGIVRIGVGGRCRDRSGTPFGSFETEKPEVWIRGPPVAPDVPINTVTVRPDGCACRQIRRSSSA
jgi:hypothetical protein